MEWILLGDLFIFVGGFMFGSLWQKSRRTKRAIDGATVSPIERDWSGEEEDKAWAHLQKPPRN